MYENSVLNKANIFPWQELMIYKIEQCYKDIKQYIKGIENIQIH